MNLSGANRLGGKVARLDLDRPQRLIQPERKTAVPIAASRTPIQKMTSPPDAPLTVDAINAPITTNGRPTSHRQLTVTRPPGGLKLRLRATRSA
jgi:hypothetical protein